MVLVCAETGLPGEVQPCQATGDRLEHDYLSQYIKLLDQGQTNSLLSSRLFRLPCCAGGEHVVMKVAAGDGDQILIGMPIPRHKERGGVARNGRIIMSENWEIE